MRTSYIPLLLLGSLLASCALEEPETKIEDTNFPLRLQIDEEGAALADAEDYGIEIAFADYIGDLPANEIVLTYSLVGEDDFANAEIDEILYEYEDGDCVFEREIDFTSETITIPVDTDLGTVPAEFEITVAFNLAGSEAAEGGFAFEITEVQSADGVLFNQINAFEYEILENDAAGEWVLEFADEAAFESFKSVFGLVSTDLAEIEFSEIAGEVVFEFEFEEVKIEIELNEMEEVTVCEDGVPTIEEESLVIELEAEYEVEGGEITLEGSYFNEDGEELDFIIEGEYATATDELTVTFKSVLDQDHYEEGDLLFEGESNFTLIAD